MAVHTNREEGVVYVNSPSPAVFFEEVQEAILSGFYADDSIIGVPMLDLVNEVRLTASEEPERRLDLPADIHTLNIQSHDNTLFMLDVQDAILQGFRIDVLSLAVSNPMHNLFVTMRRDVVEQEDPDDSGLVGDEDDVVSPPKRRGRPARSKEL